MDYVITISDTLNWGVGAARAEHNAALPPTVPDPVNPQGAEIPNPLLIDTDTGYVQFVMSRAVQSWCAHFPAADPKAPDPCAGRK